MAKADFSSYLKIKAEDIKRPAPLPAGHYLAELRKWDTSERNFAPRGEEPKMTPICTLTFQLSSACDDVETPPADFGQFVTKDYTLDKLNAAGEYRGQSTLRYIAEDLCGVPAKGLDLDELLDAAIGSMVKVFNEPRAGRGDDADNFYTNITRVLSAHD